MTKLRGPTLRRKAAVRLLQWMERSEVDGEARKQFCHTVCLSERDRALYLRTRPAGCQEFRSVGSLLARRTCQEAAIDATPCAPPFSPQRADQNSYAAFFISCATPDALGALFSC